MFDIRSRIIDDIDGTVLHERQEIPREYLDALRADRDASLEPMMGREMHRVASVPVELVTKWLREGFNVYEARPVDILKRLRKEDMDAFITTKRRI